MNRALPLLLILLTACDGSSTSEVPQLDLLQDLGPEQRQDVNTPMDGIDLADTPDAIDAAAHPDTLDSTDLDLADTPQDANPLDLHLPDSLPDSQDFDQIPVNDLDDLVELPDLTDLVPDLADDDELADTHDVAEDLPDLTPPPCPDPGDLEGLTFTGTVYFDSDGSSDSLYHQTIAPAFDSPLEGSLVELHLPDGTTLTRSTCPDGTFAFGSLPEGPAISHAVTPEGMWPSTANNPRRFAEALSQGEITIVTLGDSIPSFGAQPYFPDRLADLLSPFMLVHNLNIAVPGTSSDDWKPTANLFQNEALPLLAEADVVVISLGGNDLNYWVGYDGELTFEEAMELANQFPVVMEKVRSNLDAIFAAIAQANPSADIVYLIYPNYAQSTYWQELAPDYISLIGVALNNELGKTRKYLSRPGVTLVDMLGATPLIDLDLCLSDPLHLSETGTHVWARQVFMALGGVILGPDPLGVSRKTGFTTLP